MPELPEVETIARSLRNPVAFQEDVSEQLNARPGIVGRVISSVDVYWARSLATPSSDEFVRMLPGQKVMGVGRRGKYLVIELTGMALLIHLRMSGDIRVEPADAATQLHDRVVIGFSDGWCLAFTDPRKFGRLWLVKDASEVTSRLGVEPLSADLTAEGLLAKLQATSQRIKPLLMDQSVIAGLGNIYTDEALFLSGIHPLTPANELSLAQVQALVVAIRHVLEEGIRRNGASIDWVYRGGDFQNYFNVYQQTGQPCPVCGTPIMRMVVAQRGTHFCPHCQPFAQNTVENQH